MTEASAQSRLHDQRLSRLILISAAVVSALMLLGQISGTAYLRGDSGYYLRDAYDLARFVFPHSRYSLGYALFLSPIARALPGDPSLAGNASLAINALLTVVAIVLVDRFLRRYLPHLLAAMLTAVLVFGQGVVTYFAEIRPEPLALVLITSMLLCLDRERDGWAVALTGLLALLRISLVPFLVVLWLVRLRRTPRAAAVALGLVAIGVAIYFASAPSGGQSYTEIGSASYRRAGGLITGVTRVVVKNLGRYSRYGVPRLVFPQRVLSSFAGILIGATMLAVITVGLVILLKRRPPTRGDRSYGVVLGASLGTLAYGAVLLTWPIRDLSAVRMIVPVAPVILLWLGTFVLAAAQRVAPRRRDFLVIAVGAVVVAVTLAGSASVLSERIGDNGGSPFLAAHEAARGSLPPGPIISTSSGSTELILHRTAYEYPAHGDLGRYARRVGSCIFVVDDTRVSHRAARWVRKREIRVLGARGPVRVVQIKASWCR
jgi:hypothetical protein